MKKHLPKDKTPKGANIFDGPCIIADDSEGNLILRAPDDRYIRAAANQIKSLDLTLPYAPPPRLEELIEDEDIVLDASRADPDQDYAPLTWDGEFEADEEEIKSSGLQETTEFIDKNSVADTRSRDLLLDIDPVTHRSTREDTGSLQMKRKLDSPHRNRRSNR